MESHQGAIDMQVTTIGLDIAKNVFQVHGIDASEKVFVRKQLRRSQVLEFFKVLPPCLIGMEACATAYYRSFAATWMIGGVVVAWDLSAPMTATYNVICCVPRERITTTMGGIENKPMCGTAST
jgi:hypothetical protein